MIRTWGPVLALFAQGACADDERVAAPLPREPVHHLRSPPDAGVRPYIGVVVPPDVVDLASKFDGVVASISVRVGDKVAPGQILVQLDPRAMREQVTAAVAAVAAAQAASRQARVDVEDARRRIVVETKAVADGISAGRDLEEAEFALKRAEAAAERAASTVAAESARLQMARDHVADLSLRSVSEGVVAMRFKDPGATIAAGSPIIRIVGQGQPRLRFVVPPDRAHTIRPDTNVIATIETLSTPLRAMVRQISPTIDPASGMVIVEAELDAAAPRNDMRPGLPATVVLAP